MKISALASASNTPVASIKLYIREGLLPPGSASSRTQAEYDEAHVRRLRLIRAFRSVHDLPLAKLAELLDLIDHPPDDLVLATGRAVSALPPYDQDSHDAYHGNGHGDSAPDGGDAALHDGAGGSPRADDLGRAETLLHAFGIRFEPQYAASRQLQRALEALDAAGLDTDAASLTRYVDAARALATEEIAAMQGMSHPQAIEYAALGTALYEPLLLALRRLGHHDALLATRGEARPCP